MSTLVLRVRLHDGRYHGEGDWPPSPARLFQALLAGVGLGGAIGPNECKALMWLENRKAPIIAAPSAWHAPWGVLFYMPNNDSDSIGGNPAQMPTIRTATKVFRPYFFDAAVPFLYAWPLATSADDADLNNARSICSLAERLYQLGRGIDMAWAWGEVLDDCQLHELLAAYPGRVFRPSVGRGTTRLPCPCPGSLDSLAQRYRAYSQRFDYKNKTFRNPPKNRFQTVSYDSPPWRQLYELRDPTAEAAFAPWPLTGAVDLVVRLRDGAVKRLCQAMPNLKAEIERVLVGRKPDGTNDGPLEDRVRIIPLPSIGHVHADREIRRVLIEVPPSCPLRPDDVHWAFSGLDLVDAKTGELRTVVTRTDDQAFFRYYGLGEEQVDRVWRTVTPAALPEDVRRWRIDPARKAHDAKAGGERAREQARAAIALRQSLRHASVTARVGAVRLQREPFEANGARVDEFAKGTRFPKQRLWHVEIHFAEPVAGPLLIGDGRFLGLGVMAPVPMAHGVHAFAIDEGLSQYPDPAVVVRALRRAVMARVQETIDSPSTLPPFFSGHEPDRTPVQSQEHSHLAFVFDPHGSRLLVLAPHVIERRRATAGEQRQLAKVESALGGMCELRAGSAGLLTIRPTALWLETDPLFAASQHWESVTPYRVTRHARGVTAKEAIEIDLRAECERRGLPRPHAIQILKWCNVLRAGLEAYAVLCFKTAVKGPLLLGKSRYMGGGLFRCASGTRTTP